MSRTGRLPLPLPQAGRVQTRSNQTDRRSLDETRLEPNQFSFAQTTLHPATAVRCQRARDGG